MKDKYSMKKTIKQTLLNGFDPILGYSYSDDTYLPLAKEREDYLNGITRIGHTSDTDIRIAILGGSTSDISYDGSWMRPLHDLLKLENLKPLIICAGISGYSSSQEVLKLIRDVLPLKPDIVISLSGVNDIGFIQASSPKRPYIHKYQEKVGQFLIEKYGTENKNVGTFFKQNIHRKEEKNFITMNKEVSLGKLVLGVEKVQESYESWHTNIRLQKAVCLEFGIEYFACLQPIFGIGNYSSSVDENIIYKAFIKERKVHKIPYHEVLVKFYEGAKKIVSENRYFMYDLTNVYEEVTDIYQDPRHPNLKGNNILALNIFNILKERNCLVNNSSIKCK